VPLTQHRKHKTERLQYGRESSSRPGAAQRVGQCGRKMQRIRDVYAGRLSGRLEVVRRDAVEELLELLDLILAGGA
jgi:hypothetical protein